MPDIDFPNKVAGGLGIFDSVACADSDLVARSLVCLYCTALQTLSRSRRRVLALSYYSSYWLLLSHRSSILSASLWPRDRSAHTGSIISLYWYVLLVLQQFTLTAFRGLHLLPCNVCTRSVSFANFAHVPNQPFKSPLLQSNDRILPLIIFYRCWSFSVGPHLVKPRRVAFSPYKRSYKALLQYTNCDSSYSTSTVLQ